MCVGLSGTSNAVEVQLPRSEVGIQVRYSPGASRVAYLRTRQS